MCGLPLSLFGWRVTMSLKNLPAFCISVTMSLSFGTDRVQYVAASKSLTRDPNCVESCRCTGVIRSITSTSSAFPFASASPARCCFLGTSFCEAPLLLAGFHLSLNCARSFWCPPWAAIISFMVFSVTVLSSANWLISSGISMFVMLARMYLCRRDHMLFRC